MVLLRCIPLNRQHDTPNMCPCLFPRLLIHTAQYVKIISNHCFFKIISNYCLLEFLKHSLFEAM